LEPSEANLNVGLHLLEAAEDDVFEFLGIQAERLEIAQRRIERGQPVPSWTDEDVLEKVLSGQRTSRPNLKRYSHKGRLFAEKVLRESQGLITSALCHEGKIRPELKDLESDARNLLNHVSMVLVGLIITTLSDAVPEAVASIATTLAVILVRRRIERLCEGSVGAL
jgi:hypothetical protein